MRVTLAALAVAAASLIAAGSAAALPEPVLITAEAPASASVNVPFGLQVNIAAEPGALDIAAQPLRLRVRVAPECGGSFAGTLGPVVIDRVLPAPAAGGAYEAGISTSIAVGGTGEETICAFVEDSQERQFATDVEEVVSVVPGCGVAKRNLIKARRGLRHLNHRIAEVRRQRRQVHSAAKRHALGKRLQRLRHKRHEEKLRIRRAKHEAALACGGGQAR